MRWADNLYVSESAYEKKGTIIKKANVNAGLRHVYFVTLAGNAEDLFDIFDAAYLKQPSFYKQELDVVGIATSREDAVELVQQMIEDIYAETGAFQVREYFTFSPEDSRNRKRARRGLWDILFS